MDSLNRYIGQARAQGQTDEQIRQALLNSNWSNEQIDAALMQLSTVRNAPKTEPLPLMKDKMYRFGVIMLVVVVVGGSLLGVGLAKTLNDSRDSSKQQETSSTSTQAGKESQSNTESVACDSESCFAPKFASCAPATLEAAAPIGAVRYDIKGAQGDGCSMLFEYTDNPNPEWTGQSMTCVFDNKKALEDAVGEVFDDLLAKSNSYSCSGPLVAILQSQ